MIKEHLHDWVTIDIGVYKCSDCNQLAVWNMKERRAILVDEITPEMVKGITGE
jgi:uncharacterized protein (UPF0212 family)